jgi:hypothetical protein
MPVPTCGGGRAREGASSEAETNPRARRSPLKGGVSPRARRSLLEGGVSPRARRSLLEGGVDPRAGPSRLEGGVDPRARRSLLEGALDWATPVGRGGHRGVGRALRVRLSERCFVSFFLQVLRRTPPVVLGDPQGCPRHNGRKWTCS